MYAEGTNTAGGVIAQGNGQINARSLWFTSPDVGTLVIYRAKQTCLANAAVSASTTLVVKTDSAGAVGGAVLTTNDFVIVASATSASYQFRTISNVGAVSSGTVSLTLGSAITCSANDTVFVCRAADVVSLTTAAETQKNLLDVFNGFVNMPLYVLLSATGTCKVAVAYDIEEFN
jgi:hypothetical protein